LQLKQTATPDIWIGNGVAAKLQQRREGDARLLQRHSLFLY